VAEAVETVTVVTPRGRAMMRRSGWVVLRDRSGNMEVNPGWAWLVRHAWKLLTQERVRG
jgi:hypothetical protein